MTSRSYCFTTFVKTIEKYSTPPSVKYCVYQYEICPDTHKLHIQGFIQFTSPQRFSAVKKIFGKSTHVEEMRGTPLEASEYCQKEETRVPGTKPFIYGTITHQGERTDICTFTEAALTLPLSALAEQYPSEFIKYHRGIDALKNATSSHRHEPPYVLWLYGSTGVGKSRFSYDTYDSVYSKPSGTVWWDGYEQQQCILLDDFDDYIPFRQLLQLLDRYPMEVQVKGSHVHINSPFIVITADTHPDFHYLTISKSERSQLSRRISEIRLIN